MVRNQHLVGSEGDLRPDPVLQTEPFCPVKLDLYLSVSGSEPAAVAVRPPSLSQQEAVLVSLGAARNGPRHLASSDAAERKR